LPFKSEPRLVKEIRDTYGTLWRIPEARPVTTPGGKSYEGCASVDVWWDRDATNKSNENLIIRQETEGNVEADVIQITMAQGYDLLHALSCALMKP
jgi:hypothetical protein